MANGDASRFPTFQWVAGILVTIILIIAGSSLSETRSDVRANQKEISQACDRITKQEAQFSYIVEGLGELKRGQERLVEELRTHEKNSVTMKRWQDIPASR